MDHTQYLILGAGPAGIQLSYFFKQAGLEHAVVDRAAVPGAFFKDFPRHRKLLSVNKVHTGHVDPEKNLRWDWNSLLSEENTPLLSDFTQRYFPSADDLVAYLEAFVKAHKIAIDYGFDIAAIHRDPITNHFVVEANDGRRRTCERLVVATGMSLPYAPQFPGVELCESYNQVSVHPQSFVNQRVLIVGKGNSAFETADNLVETASLIHLSSPRPLKLAWQSHFVGHLRAVNNNILDTYQLKSQNAILDAEISSIRQKGDEYHVTFGYAHADGEEEVLSYDRVILCTGFRFDNSLFGEECRPTLTACGRMPCMTSSWESDNVSGLYFAGTLMQSRDYKRYMSSFIHGFRYNVRVLSHIVEGEHHGKRWPSRTLEMDAPSLGKALLERINRSSALWQQPGFLADVVKLDALERDAEYLEETSLDYALEHQIAEGPALVLTLEFGKEKAIDPFHVERVHRKDVENAARSAFLHPIVRFFVDGKLVAEHHVLEDLAAEWHEPEHVEPLAAFVDDVLVALEQANLTRLSTSYPAPKNSGFVTASHGSLGYGGGEPMRMDAGASQ